MSKGKGKGKQISRRDFLRLTGLATAGTIVAACGAPAPATSETAAPATGAGGAATTAPATAAAEVTPAPAVTEAAMTATPAMTEAAPTATAEAAGAAATAAATPTRVVPRGSAAKIDRNKSLILMWTASDVGIGNPYATGFNHQRGNAAWLEPLYYFSAFGNKTIPWLAESHQYSPDNKSLTIKMRSGVEWSDGQPFTAKDVAFTLNMLRQNEKLAYGADMKKWVKDAQAPDDATVQVTFTQPAPRFVFDFLTSKFDLGIFYVPEHIFKDIKDVAAFTFYDPSKNWPLVTGPYKTVDWTPQQQIMDLRKDWWAAKTGFAKLPEVQRIITVPFPDDPSVAAQAAISNEIDTSLDLRPPLIKTVIDKNPKIITHTQRDKPYGYTDWWPNSLWFNNEVPPYNDKDIRYAVNYAINRPQIVEVGYEGAGVTTDLPFPQFPSLQKYIDAAQPLLKKYPTSDYDLSKTDKIMTDKGYTKNSDGLWVGKDGKTLDATLYGFGIFADYGPVLAEQLRAGGFDSSFQQPPDAYTKMVDGSAKTFLFGHGGAIADVYPTLDLWHSRNNAPTGTAAGTITARWKNADFDKIVDQMAQFPPGDDKAIPLFLQALEIYLREKPELPIIQWLHRIPYNTTYWTNWPTKDNPYVNGAFWHKTFPLILYNLKAVS